MREMFCFQCQQTARNTGCDGKAGVCGKKTDTANYQDELIGALGPRSAGGHADAAHRRADFEGPVHNNYRRELQQRNRFAVQGRDRKGEGSRQPWPL